MKLSRLEKFANLNWRTFLLILSLQIGVRISSSINNGSNDLKTVRTTRALVKLCNLLYHIINMTEVGHTSPLIEQGKVPDTLTFNEASFPLPIGDLTLDVSLVRTGQSLVYAGEYSDGSRGVAKINYRKPHQTIKEMMSTGESVEQVEQRLRPARLAELQSFITRRQELSDYFPGDVPDEQWELENVRLQAQTLQYVLSPDCRYEEEAPALNPCADYQLETIIRTQPFDERLHHPDRVCTAFRYAEFSASSYDIEEPSPLDVSDYISVTDSLTQPSVVDLTQGNSSEVIEGLASLQNSTYLKDILANITYDPALAVAVRAFLDRLDRYQDATDGRPVDAIGIDNIVFVPNEQGEWGCILADALETRDAQVLPLAQDILVNVARGNVPSADEFNILVNVLNYTRGINGLAVVSGSSMRITLPLPEDIDNRITWKRVLALAQIPRYGFSDAMRRRPVDLGRDDPWNGELQRLGFGCIR